MPTEEEPRKRQQVLYNRRVLSQSWVEEEVGQGTSSCILVHKLVPFLPYPTMQQVTCFQFPFLALDPVLFLGWVSAHHAALDLILVLIPLFRHQLNNQWEVVNNFFFALLLHTAFVFLIKLSLSQSMSFSILFSSPVLLSRGSEKTAWWGTGNQQKSNHHINLQHFWDLQNVF